MALLTLETDYPNILKLVNMCLADNNQDCLFLSGEEYKYIFTPLFNTSDSYESEKMAIRLIEALEGITKDNRRELATVLDGVWEKREEELQLNKQLYEEATNDKVDYTAIEELLKKGANPIDIYGYGLLGSPVFSDIVNDRKSKAELPAITELFLRYGMDVNSTINDPLHTLTWIRDIYGFETMKLIFDSGMGWLDVDDYIGDMVGDMWQFERFYPNDADSMESLFWAMREMMYLAALVADDIDKCEWVYKLIRPDLNQDTSLKEFLAWDKFEYEYVPNKDTDEFSRNRLDGKTIIIRRKESEEVVWKFKFDR